MGKSLVIVESPAKAKTINKYLGKDFKVMASYGHVRDLVPKQGAVNTDDFSMKYEIIKKNKKYIDAICDAVKNAKALYLATDPDREGEAISWHVYEILKAKNLLNGTPVYRIVFHEITKSAIEEAIANPRQLSEDLINAQQARRALDYLVGFNLSPLLWRKIKRGLSAGRVQSPALRMIVEREMEIEAFVPQEYWTIEADLNKDRRDFIAKLIEFEGEKIEQFSIGEEGQAETVRAKLLQEADGTLEVVSVEKKKRKRRPSAPFTTSTLQQEASRKLGFTAQRTMRVAQQLYEGIDIGDGAVGLITYMRTDSVAIADEAVREIRDLIADRYGDEKVPKTPNVYKTKTKNAQEAHEAVRPTSVMRVPEEIKAHLSSDQFKLYDMIWKRTVACQMIDAVINTVAVNFACGAGNTFRATGSSVAVPGFLEVYEEGLDETKESDEQNMLPELKSGERVKLKDIRAEQHFTKPPPRYTEASLIKSLEEYGIGRPSTYTSIISTLLARDYVELENKRFRPTNVGRVVNAFLTEHFNQYVNYEFTAELEDELDEISRGERDWVPVMQDFWREFHTQVEEKSNLSRTELIQDRILGEDPKTGKPVSVRMAKFGPVVQIGTKDDEEKPRFAGIPPDMSMETITLEEALHLFKLPRELGETDEGEPISVNIGRYGPYVRFGNKFASLKKDDDPYTITRERALELIAEKKEAEANKVIKTFEDSPIQVLRGRYGPYITDGNKNARIPKGTEPESLTLETCQELIAAAPEKKNRRRGGRKKAT
ncbi:MAG: DNA topoisomerase I [Gemmatimonadetes bacterium]|nr:MAG: DNA topoisomerase I [Gemmatimonadota bacterium]